MRLSDFDYKFPERLVAQFPLEDRAAAKLMVLKRSNEKIQHKKFTDIVEYLNPNDVLVFNNTRVIPARIFGKKVTGGKLDILLVKEKKKNLWDCLLKPTRRLKTGTRITLANSIEAEIHLNQGDYHEIQFKTDQDIQRLLGEIGSMPLPHYIKRAPQTIDRQYYQTVYADKDGSIAAPTAGLHFTESLMNEVESRGVAIAKITLNIGPGTFLLIRNENVEQHRMASEYYEISNEAKAKIENARRVIAVGTSAVRVLETVAEKRKITNQKGWAELFIFPGYQFKIVDGLVTNFHLPKGTPLLLTAAFAGKEFLFKAYQEAVKSEYRLFSYGDAMLII